MNTYQIKNDSNTGFCISYHEDGTKPQNNEIFVFGSNLAGRHGAGAAKAARIDYGAKYGEFDGMTGNSYAIPTKSADLKTLRLSEIEVYVKKFVQFTLDNPHVEFFVTRVGCGLAGYKNEQVAPMFKGIGRNCNAPYQWRKHL